MRPYFGIGPYEYAATVVTAGGLESAYSTETKAIVPAQWPPPPRRSMDPSVGWPKIGGSHQGFGHFKAVRWQN